MLYSKKSQHTSGRAFPDRLAYSQIHSAQSQIVSGMQYEIMWLLWYVSAAGSCFTFCSNGSHRDNPRKPVGTGIRLPHLPRNSVQWERKPNIHFITIKCDKCYNRDLYQCCGNTENAVFYSAWGGHRETEGSIPPQSDV